MGKRLEPILLEKRFEEGLLKLKIKYDAGAHPIDVQYGIFDEKDIEKFPYKLEVGERYDLLSLVFHDKLTKVYTQKLQCSFWCTNSETGRRIKISKAVSELKGVC